MSSFSAPWSTSVQVVSWLVALISLWAVYQVARIPGAPVWVVLLPLAILVGAALFTVRGYELVGTELLVRRLVWSTRIDLSGMRRATHDPQAIRRSWRLFGNGGLFSISGLYRNKTLGNYRAFATDPARAVILEFEHRRIVVTPGEPEELLRQLQGRELVAREA